MKEVLNIESFVCGLSLIDMLFIWNKLYISTLRYNIRKKVICWKEVFSPTLACDTKSNVRILGFWIPIRNKRKNLLSKQKKISNSTRKTNVNRFKVAISFFFVHAGFNKQTAYGFRASTAHSKVSLLLFF